MQIVTLTTDLGLKDHFVATLKGQMYSKTTHIQFVDVTHQVKTFNINEAAYYINNITTDFPEGTIHYIGVDSVPTISINTPQTNCYPIVMKINNQYFIGSDSGVFSLLNDYENAEMIVRLDFSSKDAIKNPFKQIYSPAIKQIAEGVDLKDIGDEVSLNDINVVIQQKAVVHENIIKGTVMHIDNYGNVIVNISETLFNEVRKEHPFIIYFRNRNYFIDKISESYNEVPNGEKLAHFNENGWLEIALNKGTLENGGGAASLLGIKNNEIIRIEIHPKGSKNRIDDLFS
jgi:S-adenosylmethionine hydrolase